MLWLFSGFGQALGGKGKKGGKAPHHHAGVRWRSTVNQKKQGPRFATIWHSLRERGADKSPSWPSSLSLAAEEKSDSRRPTKGWPRQEKEGSDRPAPAAVAPFELRKKAGFVAGLVNVGKEGGRDRERFRLCSDEHLEDDGRATFGTSGVEIKKKKGKNRIVDGRRS